MTPQTRGASQILPDRNTMANGRSLLSDSAAPTIWQVLILVILVAVVVGAHQVPLGALLKDLDAETQRQGWQVLRVSSWTRGPQQPLYRAMVCCVSFLEPHQ